MVPRLSQWGRLIILWLMWECTHPHTIHLLYNSYNNNNNNTTNTKIRCMMSCREWSSILSLRVGTTPRTTRSTYRQYKTVPRLIPEICVEKNPPTRPGTLGRSTYRNSYTVDPVLAHCNTKSRRPSGPQSPTDSLPPSSTHTDSP